MIKNQIFDKDNIILLYRLAPYFGSCFIYFYNYYIFNIRNHLSPTTMSLYNIRYGFEPDFSFLRFLSKSEEKDNS